MRRVIDIHEVNVAQRIKNQKLIDWLIYRIKHPLRCSGSSICNGTRWSEKKWMKNVFLARIPMQTLPCKLIGSRNINSFASDCLLTRGSAIYLNRKFLYPVSNFKQKLIGGKGTFALYIFCVSVWFETFDLCWMIRKWEWNHAFIECLVRRKEYEKSL